MFLTKLNSFCFSAVFTACAALMSFISPSLAEPSGRSLTDYSTEEIVSEYQYRLKATGLNEASGLSDLLIQADLVSDIDSEERARYLAKFQNTLAAMKPFVDAGEKEPIAFTGYVILNGFTLVPPDLCKGLTLLRKAAILGSLAAPIAISDYFGFRYRNDGDRTHALSSLFWAKEAVRRDPSFSAILTPVIQKLSEKLGPGWESQWSTWSPVGAQNIATEIEHLCE